MKPSIKYLYLSNDSVTYFLYKFQSHIAYKFSDKAYIFKHVKLKFTPLDIQPKSININSKTKVSNLVLIT